MSDVPRSGSRSGPAFPIGQASRFQGFIPWALVCVLAVLCLDTVSATVVLPADFVTVVNGSAGIVHGRVTDVRSELVEPGRTIQTFVTVDVIRTLKGAATGTVVFSVPNGQVGRYRRVVVGAPEFARGDEVVVFLRGSAPAVPALFGLGQGVYRVVRDAASRPFVTPPPVMARGVAAERVVRGDPVRQAMPVDVFAREVEAVLERAQ